MKLPNMQMARGRRHHTSTILIRSIVIALCSVTVITTTVQSSSIGASSTADQQPSQQAAAVAPTQEANEAAATSVAKQPKQPDQVAASASPAEQQQAKPSEPSAKSALDSSLAAEQTRKGRSEAPPLASSEPAAAAAKTSSQPGAPEATKSTSKPAPVEQKPAAASSSSKQPAAASSASSQTKQQQLAGKSGSSSFSSSTSSASKKLPANLGTVTSTGSGGPAHYMSKHDAYSAIAEKHGALAQDAMRKADKRNHNLQRFSGIQKASGFSDALNPFKTVTDGGLARSKYSLASHESLGASMRSIMKGKYSIPAYVASAVLGAVALMAFYESPISPLPVPALPEPPVGRFPPEMPVISPNLQVPFRMNQQQQQQQYGQQYGQQNGYGNQRSFQTTGNLMAPATNQQQQQQPNQDQPQQVLFPGATTQSAQQRQGVAAPGPVQQLAANLISSVGANRQTAQRKSGPDSDSVLSSRSFFGSSAQLNTNNNKLSAPANQQKHHKPSGVSSMFSFLGLGGGSGSGSASSGNQPSSSGPGSSLQASLGGLGDVHRASGLGSQLMAAAGTTGHDISSSLSNSHLVNKMKSYFDRPVPHNSWSMDHNQPNQYDQYRRMSIMQALAKDTAFLSSFFSPSRRSSNSTSASSGPANSIQQSINAVLSGASGSSGPTATPQVASSRMQVDHVTLPGLMSAPFGLQPVASSAGQQQQQPAPAKRASSGYGLMRAADRITHALLDTFTSGLLHRSSESTTANSKKAAAALEEQQQQQQQQQQNALASATSILSDIMSSYNAANQASAELNNQQQQQQQHTSQMESAAKQQASSGAAGSMGPNGNEQASGRSADLASSADKQTAGEQSAAVGAPTQQAKQQQQAVSEQQQAIAQQQPLNRKVRSIGLDYPMEPVQQQQQQQQQPSRATQINSLVDYVSDSYKQNKLLFSFVMNQVGLSQALPYVEQFLGNPNESKQ